MENYIFTLLTLADVIIGQSINTPPIHATHLEGQTANFMCILEKSRVMSWTHNGDTVYSYDDPNEGYPKGEAKYSVKQDGKVFNLTVKNLTFGDGGTYRCELIKDQHPAMLVVLQKKPLITSVAPAENCNRVTYTCSAKFGSPSKEEMSSEHFPKLNMYMDGNQLLGEVKKNTSSLQQEFEMIVDDDKIGKILTCVISTSKPTLSAEKRLLIKAPKPVCKTAASRNGNAQENTPNDEAVREKEEYSYKDLSGTRATNIILIVFLLVTIIAFIIICVIFIKLYKEIHYYMNCNRSEQLEPLQENNG